MLTANTAFCVRLPAGSVAWKCLTGWPRKNWRGEALLSVEFLCSGDSLWAWESLLLTQMKLHDFLLHAQIACHTRAFSPPSACRSKSNSVLTSLRLCFNVFCALVRLLSSAHFQPPPKNRRRHSKSGAVHLWLAFAILRLNQTGVMCCFLYWEFLFGQVLIRVLLQYFWSGLHEIPHPGGLATSLHLLRGKTDWLSK